MSQEDVRSAASLVAESSASNHCNGHSLIQGQDRELEGQSPGQSPGQDGIVLERFASLSLDMFDPSDFTGRFTKVQSRSRKRTRIIGGRCRRAWGFSFCFNSERDKKKRGSVRVGGVQHTGGIALI